MAKLVAVCGIDGAGKSSLIRGFSGSSAGRDFLCVGKSTSRDADLTKRFIKRSKNPKQDWLGGPFAESIAIGSAFDFLEHYAQNIQPKLHAKQPILADRHLYCFAAYMRCVRCSFDFEALFHHVRQPDHVIHVDVDDALLESRYLSRDVKNEDEFLPLMIAFRNGYSDIYRELGIEPHFITNNGPVEETLDNFSTLVTQLSQLDKNS